MLFSVESGSRAYGFHSEDSDYDIRGVYRQSFLAYLDLKGVMEQISLQEENKDLVLWDLRKAIRLITVSNPSILDWLSSRIVYQQHLQDELKNLARTYYSTARYFQANYGLAKSHFRKYILDKEEVDLKVYLYTIRALAACRYVLREPFAPAVGFDFTSEYPAYQTLLKELIKAKKEGFESTSSSVLKDDQSTMVISNFTTLIGTELEELDIHRAKLVSRKPPEMHAANECFQKLLFSWG